MQPVRRQFAAERRTWIHEQALSYAAQEARKALTNLVETVVRMQTWLLGRVNKR